MGDASAPPGSWTPGWVTVLPPHVKDPLLKFYSEAELATICAALARPPNSTCVRVNTLKHRTEDFVPLLRAELAALAEGSCDDAAQNPYGSVQQHSLIPDAVLIEPRGKPATAVFAEGREVLISRRCAESVLRGADVFVPGMIGCSPRAAKGDSVTVLCDIYDRFLRGSSTHILSTGKLDPKRMKGCVAKKIPSGSEGHPSEFRVAGERLDHKYGREEEAQRIQTAEERSERLPAGIVVIGKGVMQVDRRDAMSATEGLGCKMTECVFRAPPLNGVLAGSMYVQNLPSLVVPHILAPLPSDSVLDMCASPGGKASHAAALMQGQGSVLALDRTEAKVRVIREWASTLGLPNLKAMKADSTALLENDNHRFDDSTPSKKKKQSSASDGQAAPKQRLTLPEESFDRIILDPPCTALGLRPRLAVDVHPVEMARTPAYQRQMLHVAVRLLKPGGRLVYSTCTINPEENECNVAWALRTLPLELIPALPRVGGPGRQECGLADDECCLVQRFEPGTELDTNGFFVAAFQKKRTESG